MPTYSALTTLPGEDAAQALAAGDGTDGPRTRSASACSRSRTAAGLWEVGAYFLEAPDEVMLDVLAMAFGAKPFAVSELPEIDWVAKVRRELVARSRPGGSSSLAAMTPTRCPPGGWPLQIEATVAFGTGHHGTTLGCLRAFDRLFDGRLPPRQGCRHRLRHGGAGDGGGGDAARRAGDRLATSTRWRSTWPRRMWRSTGCRAGSNVWRRRASTIRVLAAAAPFDLVFANILKGPLIELAPRHGGACWQPGAERSCRVCWWCRPRR